jgi:hypothetical protein
MRAIPFALAIAMSSPAAADRPQDVWCGTPWADRETATTTLPGAPGVDIGGDIDLVVAMPAPREKSFAERLAARLAGELTPPTPPTPPKSKPRVRPRR